MTHGVVVGKFYPPHRGHRHLIDVAVSQSDRVTVLVVDGRAEDPPADTRAEWLRELHPDATVKIARDIERDEDSVAWARATREAVGGRTIDKVFDSEPYGTAWAAAISEQQGSDCENVFVGRGLVEISGTQVRSHPARYWSYIDALVRAHYIKRVCIVGAESTGSTTLARSLAAAYGTIWVPEYGREYTVEKFTIGTGDRWLPSDFLRIALEQNALEDRMAREAPAGILFCDTDSLATALWEEVYLGSTSQAVWRAADAHGSPYALYLLTDHAGVPWEQDGLRLGDETRAKMTDRFEQVLTARGLPWTKVTGSRTERLHQAADAIKPFFPTVFSTERGEVPRQVAGEWTTPYGPTVRYTVRLHIVGERVSHDRSSVRPVDRYVDYRVVSPVGEHKAVATAALYLAEVEPESIFREVELLKVEHDFTLEAGDLRDREAINR